MAPCGTLDNYILQWLEKQWVAHLCYADDTLLLVSGESVQEVQQKCTQIIRGLKDQMEKSTLNLNTQKTEVMLLTKKREISSNIPLKIVVDKEEVQEVHIMKYLGV